MGQRKCDHCGLLYNPESQKQRYCTVECRTCSNNLKAAKKWAEFVPKKRKRVDCSKLMFNDLKHSPALGFLRNLKVCRG